MSSLVSFRRHVRRSSARCHNRFVVVQVRCRQDHPSSLHPHENIVAFLVNYRQAFASLTFLCMGLSWSVEAKHSQFLSTLKSISRSNSCVVVPYPSTTACLFLFMSHDIAHCSSLCLMVGREHRLCVLLLLLHLPTCVFTMGFKAPTTKSH